MPRISLHLSGRPARRQTDRLRCRFATAAERFSGFTASSSTLTRSSSKRTWACSNSVDSSVIWFPLIRAPFSALVWTTRILATNRSTNAPLSSEGGAFRRPPASTHVGLVRDAGNSPALVIGVAVEFFGLWSAVAGCAVSAVGAVWLLVGFSPNNPKYVDDGMLYPGVQRSQVLPQLLKDQRGVASLVVIGTTLQLGGAVLTIVGQ